MTTRGPIKPAPIVALQDAPVTRATLYTASRFLRGKPVLIVRRGTGRYAWRRVLNGDWT